METGYTNMATGYTVKAQVIQQIITKILQK